MAVPQALILLVSLGWEGFERIFLLNAARTPAIAHGARFVEPALIGTVIIMMTYFVVYAVALGATTFAVSDVYLGRATTARAAYRRIRARFWGLINIILAVGIRTILVYALLWIVLVLFAVVSLVLVRNMGIIPKILVILITIGGYCAGLFYATRFVLRYGCTVPALLLEKLKTGDAIKRSISLTKKQLGRIFLVGLLMSIVSWVVALILEGPFLFAEIYTTFKHHAHPALWLTACGSIAAAIGHAVTGPLLMIGLVLLYYDIRIRKEGFDLQVMMAALDGKEHAPGATVGSPILAPKLEKTNVPLLVLLTIFTFGLYYPIWFMRRRAGINSLRSQEKLSFSFFAVVLSLLLLVLLLNIGQNYFTFVNINWLRFLDSLVWSVSVVLLVIQSFKVKRILEAHATESSEGIFANSISLAQESTLSGVTTFFFGIFYLQHKINEMIEAWPEGEPGVGIGPVPVV